MNAPEIHAHRIQDTRFSDVVQSLHAQFASERAALAARKANNPETHRVQQMEDIEKRMLVIQALIPADTVLNADEIQELQRNLEDLSNWRVAPGSKYHALFVEAIFLQLLMNMKATLGRTHRVTRRIPVVDAEYFQELRHLIETEQRHFGTEQNPAALLAATQALHMVEQQQLCVPSTMRQNGRTQLQSLFRT